MTEEMKKEETVNETADTAENVVEQEETVQEPEAEAKTETAAEDETKEESDALDEADTPKEKKKLFSKKKDKKDEKIEELTDQLRRQMAEFDNYRKRTDKEKASMYIIDGGETIVDRYKNPKGRWGIAELYIERPGAISKTRNDMRKLILQAPAWRKT